MKGMKTMIFVPFFFLFLPLSLQRFDFSIRRIRLKWEPGENPGQSRCCKLFKFLSNTLPTGGIISPGRALKNGVSQKTCRA